MVPTPRRDDPPRRLIPFLLLLGLVLAPAAGLGALLGLGAQAPARAVHHALLGPAR